MIMTAKVKSWSVTNPTLKEPSKSEVHTYLDSPSRTENYNPSYWFSIRKYILFVYIFQFFHILSTNRQS